MTRTLSEVINGIETGELSDNDILTNVDTGERVIVRGGALHFLTMNDYISNNVPLVSGLINSKWELKQNVKGLKAVDIEEAITQLVYGNKVMAEIDRGTGEKIVIFEALSELLDHIGDLVSISGVEDLLFTDFYIVPEETTESTDKYRRKTTESEAWGILMDRYYFKFTVEHIAEKYNISIRNVYYIVDGTYYTKVYDRFMSMYKEDNFIDRD